MERRRKVGLREGKFAVVEAGAAKCCEAASEGVNVCGGVVCSVKSPCEKPDM